MSSSSQKQQQSFEEKGSSKEVNVLSDVVANLRALSFDEGFLADDPSKINSQLKDAGLDQTEVSSRHIESLVALGVLGRVISGGASYLAWMNERDKDDPIPVLTRSADLLSNQEKESLEVIDAEDKQAVETNDLFKLDVELDMEHEKLLLYRSLIVVEAIAGLLLLRQMLLWFFQL